jgi:hypothetical protein
MSKEIINVARVAEFQASGLAVFGVYRARKHTFPLSDLGDGAGELCRNCFFTQMFHAFEIADLSEDNVLRKVRPDVVKLARSKGAVGVVMHTLLWYIQLRAGVPLLPFSLLILGNQAEIAKRFESTVAASTSRELFSSSRANDFAEEIVRTRKDSTWHYRREARYASFNIEHYAQRLISLLRELDSSTDLQLLETDGDFLS